MTSISKHINIEGILKALENHIIHGAEMTSTQVNAALTILKKAYPDVKSAEKENNPVLTYEDALRALSEEE